LISNLEISISDLSGGLLNLEVESLQYKIIKTDEQYWDYCSRLERLVTQGNINQEVEEEIDLLNLLIEKWDDEHDALGQSNPVELLKYLMEENKIKSNQLADLLGVSKSVVSEILYYKKGFSKENIRKLAERFKVNQELFNKPYKLVSATNIHLRNASVMNTRKNLVSKAS
jgi:HTH-type transcriptional regulator/antitoxin HigA